MRTTTTASAANLRQEIQLLRSFVIGLAGRDAEGNYRPSFVRKVLAAATETPKHRFTGAQSFLTHLRRQ